MSLEREGFLQRSQDMEAEWQKKRKRVEEIANVTDLQILTVFVARKVDDRCSQLKARRTQTKPYEATSRKDREAHIQLKPDREEGEVA